MSGELATALAAIDRAEKAVADLCDGRLRWEMRVPAEPDHDPDLIISEALRQARSLLMVYGPVAEAMAATPGAREMVAAMQGRPV